MPRNGAAEAAEAAKVAEANYRASEKALARALGNRKRAMVRCRKAGMSMVDIGKIFGVSDAQVSNVWREAQAAAPVKR